MTAGLGTPVCKRCHDNVVHDEDYRSHVWRALEQLDAALSETAIDHYAAEKLDNAELAIQAARRRLVAVTGYLEEDVRR